MKKISFILLGLVAVAIASCEKNDPQPEQPVETTWKADSMLSVSNPPKRVIYTYDNNGDLIQRFTQNFKDSVWKDVSKFIYTNSNHLQTSATMYSFRDTAWVCVQKEEYTYNAQKLMTSRTFYTVKNNALSLISTATYTYNDKGQQTEAIITNGKGENSSRQLFYYDKSGRDSLVNIFNWDNQTWKPSYKYEYTYTATTCTETHYKANATSGWVNYSKTVTTYDEKGREVLYMTAMWSSNKWKDEGKYIYTYDANGNLATEEAYWWNNTEWKFSSKDTYYYSKH